MEDTITLKQAKQLIEEIPSENYYRLDNKDVLVIDGVLRKQDLKEILDIMDKIE